MLSDYLADPSRCTTQRQLTEVAATAAAVAATAASAAATDALTAAYQRFGGSAAYYTTGDSGGYGFGRETPSHQLCYDRLPSDEFVFSTQYDANVHGWMLTKRRPVSSRSGIISRSAPSPYRFDLIALLSLARCFSPPFCYRYQL